MYRKKRYTGIGYTGDDYGRNYGEVPDDDYGTGYQQPQVQTQQWNYGTWEERRVDNYGQPRIPRFIPALVPNDTVDKFYADFNAHGIQLLVGRDIDSQLYDAWFTKRIISQEAFEWFTNRLQRIRQNSGSAIDAVYSAVQQVLNPTQPTQSPSANIDYRTEEQKRADSLTSQADYYAINAQEQTAMVARRTTAEWYRIEKFIKDTEENRIIAGSIEKVPIGTLAGKDSMGMDYPAYNLTNAVLWISKSKAGQADGKHRWLVGYNNLVNPTPMYQPPLVSNHGLGNPAFEKTAYEVMQGIAFALSTLERPGSDYAGLTLEIDPETSDFEKSLKEALAKEKANATAYATANTQENGWSQQINVADNNIDQLLLQEQMKQQAIDAQHRLDDMNQKYQQQMFDMQQQQLEQQRQQQEVWQNQQAAFQAQQIANQQAALEQKQRQTLTNQSNDWFKQASTQQYNAGVQEFNSTKTSAQNDYNKNWGVTLPSPTPLINTNFAPPPAPQPPKGGVSQAVTQNPKGGVNADGSPTTPEGDKTGDKKFPLWAKIGLGVLGVGLLAGGGYAAYKAAKKGPPTPKGGVKKEGKGRNKETPKAQGNKVKDKKPKPNKK